MMIKDKLLTTVKDSLVISSVIYLNDGGDINCEYFGCSGDCDCDGDIGLPNPGATE